MMDRDKREEFEELLEEATSNADTDWEINFVDDIEKQATNPLWEPTERQWAKLRQIAWGLDG